MSEVNNVNDRSMRKVRRGVVKSNKMEKTVIVTLNRQVQHPLYGKTIRRSQSVAAHDLLGCDIWGYGRNHGDPPDEQTKRWRVVSIIEKVK